MAAIQVTDVRVLSNPCTFVEPFRFEITFEASQELQDDLEWRVTYVGSADSEEYDQILDSVLVGPVPLGTNRFIFEAPAPDPSKIPAGDLLGVTVVLVECLYRDKVFVRVGYYVSNENPDDPVAGSAPGGAGEEGMEVEDIDKESSVSSEEEEDEEGQEDGEEDVQMEEGAANENKHQQHQQQSGSGAAAVKPVQSNQQQSKAVVNIEPARIRRVILDDKPRVTRFPIPWDIASQQQQQQQQQFASSESVMPGQLQAHTVLHGM